MGSFGSPVIVKRKEVVAALLPEQNHWLPMSNLDLLLPPLDVGIFFCYKKHENAGSQDENMANVMKKALARVLVSFYPFAGELVENSLGEPELLCNNRGVDFATAYADLSLKELDLYRPDESIHEMLVPSRNRGVLSIQVTEFKCGGLVVGCSFDHRVADAHSANMFLAAWAETAQSKPITRIPSFRRSILGPRRPGQYCDDASFDKLYVPISSVTPPAPCSDDDHLLSRIYYIRAEEIDWLQSLAMAMGSKRSKLQSFTAFLWKIIAEGGDDVFKTCRMGIVVDGRERLISRDDGAKMSSPMQNYFGNVLSIPFGEANSDQLKTKSLSQVADMVHGILAGATTMEHFRGLIDWVESHRPEAAAARIYCQTKESNGEAVVVSSGQRFPVDKLDFGWGKPDFGSYHFHWGGETGYVMPMPSANRKGDWIVYMHLSQKHLDLVETKGGHVFRPLTCSYLNF